MEITTGLLTVDDTELVETVLAWHWHEWSGGHGDADLEAWRERLRTRAGADGIPFTLVAWIDDQPVGCVTVCDDDVDIRYADRWPWLSGVFVIRSARNLGVGRRLLIDAATRAQEFGAIELWLHTGEASRFYERCGYRVVHSKEAIDDEAVLSRALSS